MMKKVSLIGLMMVPSALFAYDFLPGDWFARPSLGAVFNVLRADLSFNDATPWAGFALNVDLDYMVDENFAVTVGTTPYFSADHMSLGASGGMKYRNVDWLNPVIFYALAEANLGFLIPLNQGKFHTNVGLTLGVGIEYFVVRDVAIDFALELEPSIAFVAGKVYGEFALRPLLGVLWRI